MSATGRTSLAARGLARRAVFQALRRPPLVAPVVILPTILLVAFSGGGQDATTLEGFPATPSFFDYELPGAIVMGSALAGISGGVAFAVDIRMGFVDRVLSSVPWRGAPSLACLSTTAFIALIASAWLLALGLIFGHPPGVLNILLMLLLGVLTAAAMSTVMGALALRSGDPSVVSGFFPLGIFMILLSSAFFPRDLLLSPAKELAYVNPLTAVANAMRDAWLDQLDGDVALTATAALLAIAAAGTTVSTLALRNRLA
jgi:ABC-type multidrug transport system permease subunit